jgi:hypothetical protein
MSSASKFSLPAAASPNDLPGATSRYCIALILLASLACSGCAVVAVADAATTVVATGVKIGATVVGTTVDIAASGVRAVVGSADKK